MTRLFREISKVLVMLVIALGGAYIGQEVAAEPWQTWSIGAVVGVTLWNIA